MKVRIFSFDETDFEICDFNEYFRIEIDGKEVFNVIEGKPTDNTIARNFSDIKRIPDLIKMAYEAGAKGEPFEIATV